MRILHGEHIVKSRDRLAALLATAQTAGYEVVKVAAKELTPAGLEEVFRSTSLFGTERLVVIEELHSLPKSARKDQLLSELAKHQAENCIVWEKRSLTKTMLKPFSAAQVEELPLSSQLFSWLDSLGSANKKQLIKQLHELYVSDSAGLVWAMLARQVRLLLSAQDDGQLTGAPFMIQKIRSQASRFTREQLLRLHSELLEIDRKLKTSGTPLTLEQQLDLLILSL